jgi:hypothetical protein
VSAIIYRFPERPRAAAGGASLIEDVRQARRSRSAEGYRPLITRLTAAGIGSDGGLADVLNLTAVGTPQGTWWDGPAVGRLRRALGLVA